MFFFNIKVIYENKHFFFSYIPQNPHPVVWSEDSVSRSKIYYSHRSSRIVLHIILYNGRLTMSRPLIFLCYYSTQPHSALNLHFFASIHACEGICILECVCVCVYVSVYGPMCITYILYTLTILFRSIIMKKKIY